MEDILLDDQFKSDEYSVSINELIFGKPYKPSIRHISDLLDNNGYYGRYKIEQVKDRKSMDTLIKIHVYLVDSAYVYTWPFQTQFNVDKKCYVHNRRVPRGIFSDDRAFLSCLQKVVGMFMPKHVLDKERATTGSFFVSICIITGRKIEENNIAVEDWAWTICQSHTCMGRYDQYKRILPFLVRIGLIVNRRPVIASLIDAEEISSNLFDINYWHNI